jgi:hypothetical protein
MRTIVVDWSGRATNESSSIWLAEAVDGELVRLESGRTRAAVVNELIRTAAQLIDANEPCFIGLDFSFSFPAWFVRQHRCETAAHMWPIVAQHGETWLAACEPPFWGRPGKPKPRDADKPQFRRTELDTQSVRGITPKSTFQIGGAGSVGTGSIRGIPHLSTLQQAGCAIWPFDSPGIVTVAEVYPRLCTGAVVKSSPAARRQYFQDHTLLPHQAALESEDAFDALISALTISQLPALSFPRHVAPDGIVEREGLIFDPRPAASQ